MKALKLAQTFLEHHKKVTSDGYESNTDFLDAQDHLVGMAEIIVEDPIDSEYAETMDELATARAEIENLKESVKYWINQTTNANKELESIHRILDRVDNPPKRNDSDMFPEGTDDWRFSNYTTVERLSVWLSKR